MGNRLNIILVRLVQLIILPTSLVFKLGVAIWQYLRNQIIAAYPDKFNPFFKGVGALKISRKYADDRQYEHRKKYYVVRLGKGFLVLNRDNIKSMKKDKLLTNSLRWADIDQIAVYISQQK